MMIRQSCRIEVKSLDVVEASHGKSGVFAGYASTFGNTDRDNDVIDVGAFDDHLRPSDVKMLWQHSMSEPIGVWKSIRADSKGLQVEGELNLEVQRGREAYALMKQGALGDMSIGFRVPKGATYEKDVGEGATKRRVRHIKQVNLLEISVVSVPANPMARISLVKTADGKLPTERDFEAWLRDEAGLSRREAAIVVAKGYRSLIDPDADQSSERDARAEEEARKAEAGARVSAEELSKTIAAMLGEFKNDVGTILRSA